jgi:hypothetical protein
MILIMGILHIRAIAGGLAYILILLIGVIIYFLGKREEKKHQGKGNHTKRNYHFKIYNHDSNHTE